MIRLYLEKLYRYERNMEHLSIAIPIRQGRLFSTNEIMVIDGNRKMPVQCKVTARYPDMSIKFVLVRFMGDLPANASKEYVLFLDENDLLENAPFYEKDDLHNLIDQSKADQITTVNTEVICIHNGKFELLLEDNSTTLFNRITDMYTVYDKEAFSGPCLQTETEIYYGKNGNWRVVESGDLVTILRCPGMFEPLGVTYELTLTVYAGKPWIDTAFRLINTTKQELAVKSLTFHYLAKEKRQACTDVLSEMKSSTVPGKAFVSTDIYTTCGIHDIAEISSRADIESIRTCAGYSNYRTQFQVGKNGAPVSVMVDGDRLLTESNEHFAEVFYGTFFADRTDKKAGVCITVFQAQQNFPKEVSADDTGLAIYLVPNGRDKVIFQPGVSREQSFLIHLHGPKESLIELDNRSLIYQMPDRPVILPQVFADSKTMADVFSKNYMEDMELSLMSRADAHGRAYGMLNWGDYVDAGYINQGRGGGKLIWVNNEYDYPHAMALMYARTGERRFFDYMVSAAKHLMDVDICHYSEDPLRIDGQIEHTVGHVVNGKVVPSHEWVEGLLDYYHLTGEERAYDAAIGIGENVRRLLETPMFSAMGETSARETGWALRSMTALYVETGNDYWLEKCEWIVEQFRRWEQDLGHWFSMYTDNTLIRVSFMIAVAIGSLTRFYRVRPSVELRSMILRQIDDLIENCMIKNSVFYYKELPSLKRVGNNTLLLEAMAIGYELTKDTKYLKAGIRTFKMALFPLGRDNGAKRKIEDAVLVPGESTKGFAQSFFPIVSFYRALEDAGISV